ncbi:NAD(P)H-dependent oxidoreductase [Flavobacterium sp. GSP27]|uniref:NAD(P)H-dependent oxidoreductase n=1 Tax=unclassified Flavobacterium TaxID=196869 RepID=UPI000F8202F8|nr:MULTISPECIES: NAD(P)H-dependent oxidoreductase [unclassified Flavobacterium]RTY94621.1 NAD(P)H-dependent oxidoreductase [Flavobacterium sp. GSN2]RTY66640.1 NAD(P)H-dependent oxidoreductase [Flavobacterium sp. LB2P53]RTY82419.1 NAD(P)H-dependent oxidoreductase [Flavobacterium sp. LS1P28]RTY84974.1 NAD(P)H-dependent oxidoreductase [Flavobacterium sp. ZB4P23]RTZ10438.1 NAD(P)H-dependent oxidoreductase [Flavobacterium sp. GSP27]
MNTFLDHQNWRYATKKFDATKKISNEDLNILKEAIRLSSSSYGLQPYKVIIVENPELRAKIRPSAWGQSQIVEASHLIIFANEINFGTTGIDNYFKNTSETRQIPLESMKGYQELVIKNITSLSEEMRNIWTAKQTYLALGNLLNAAAELKIDATPMEGFVPAEVNEILGLDKLGLNATLIATIGYRHEEDATQHNKKVRKSNEELFITL